MIFFLNEYYLRGLPVLSQVHLTVFLLRTLFTIIVYIPILNSQTPIQTLYITSYKWIRSY